jgi:hypothetical protein
MKIALKIPKALIDQFKAAGNGLADPEAANEIAMSVLSHFGHSEITVLDSTKIHEIFCVGEPFPPNHRSPQPSHGVWGVHVHESKYGFGTNILKIHRSGKSNKAFELKSSPDRDFYVQALLLALESGEYRVGF